MKTLRDNLNLFDNSEYVFQPDGGDFTSKDRKNFFQVLLAMYYAGYSNAISVTEMEKFIHEREFFAVWFDDKTLSKFFGEFQYQDESEDLQDATDKHFDYYYSQLKKYTLVREYAKQGVDMSFVLSDIVSDPTNYAAKQKAFDRMSITEIADLVTNKIEGVRDEIVYNITNDSVKIDEGMEDLIGTLGIEPEVGAPLYGDAINWATRGARLGKFYLRSSPTGVGKTRTMVADMCTIACGKYYVEGEGWINLGTPEPALFISTELQLDEIQTMALAFISGISEDKILNGEVSFKDNDVLKEALKVFRESKLFVEVVPDFTVSSIENVIKRSLRINHTQYVAFDYINTSIGILQEMASQTKGVAMREDNILFLMSTKLKEIATEYNIFIESSTQTNASFKTDPMPDATLLKGQRWALLYLILVIAKGYLFYK